MTQLSTAEANRINRANRVNYETKLGTRLRALEGEHIKQTGTEAQVLICAADGVPEPKTVSGDVTINAAGSVTIGSNKITNAKMADDSVDTAEIVDDAVGTDQIADDAVGTDQIEDKAVGFPALADTERDEKIRLQLPGGDTAGTDWEIVIGTPDHAGTVKSIKLITNTTFGKDTDYSTLTVYNREDDDTGTASVGANAFDAAGAATARVAKALTLSGTPANLTVGATDVLTLKKTHTGEGQSVPGGVLELVYTRTA